jgi:hypothetical protein
MTSTNHSVQNIGGYKANVTSLSREKLILTDSIRIEIKTYSLAVVMLYQLRSVYYVNCRIFMSSE